MTPSRKYLVLILVITLGACFLLFAQNKTPDFSHFKTSLADEKNGDYASALSEMEPLYKAAQDNYLVNLRMGWLEYLSKDYNKSARYYRRATELSQKQSVEALLGLRLPLAAQQDWSAVEDVYLQILQLDPANYEANLRLGQIYSNRGDCQHAKSYLETVVAHYPSDYETNLAAAWNDYCLSDLARSKLEFETVLMISPGDTSATRGLDLLK